MRGRRAATTGAHRVLWLCGGLALAGLVVVLLGHAMQLAPGESDASSKHDASSHVDAASGGAVTETVGAGQSNARTRPSSVAIVGWLPAASEFQVVCSADSERAFRSATLLRPSTGQFRVDVPAPTSRVQLFVVAETGTRWQWSGERTAAEGWQDWDLGHIVRPPTAIRVILQVLVDGGVRRDLVGCGLVNLAAKIVDTAASGAVAGTHTFSLAEDMGAAVREAAVEVMVRDETQPLRVSWSFAEMVPALAVAQVDTRQIGANQHTAEFRLLPELVVRGTVRWPDGEPASGQVLRYWGTGDDLPGVAVRTGSKGEFCVFVGAQQRGRVELDVLERLATLDTEPAVRVVAGDNVEIVRQRRLRFRLLDERAAPILGFQVGSSVPRRVLIAANERGEAWELRAVLESTPWLRVRLADGSQPVFLVPAAWFGDAEQVHELRIGEALAVGSFEMQAGAAGRSLAGAVVTVRGRGCLRGIEMQSAATGASPWVMSAVPIGDYDVEFRARAGGTVVPLTVHRVDADARTVIRVP